MNKKNIIILTIATLFFLGALAIFIYAKSLTPKNESLADLNTNLATPSSVESDAEKEPYFYDIDGNTLSFKDFSGKPTVVLLWKSDNAKSYTLINLITKYYESYKDQIHFLTINVNEPDIDLDLIENVKAAGFQIPIYFDTDLTLYNEFYYEKLPDLFFISEDGEIEKEAIEKIDEDAFEANLRLLVGDY